MHKRGSAVIKRLLSVATAVFCILVITAGASSAGRQKPFNRIVIVIDASGTFKDHCQSAIDKTEQILEKIAQRTEHRYEEQDRIYLISLDARPEVIWAGRRDQVSQLAGKKLSALFDRRKQYSGCTDVAAAFNLAAFKLNRAPEPAAKWLFVFSDLIDEPPAAPGQCRAPRRPSPPPENIRWDRLSDTAIGVFWAPDTQIMAWEDALAETDLAIRFYDEAEARNVSVPSLPRARHKMSARERAEKKRKLAAAAKAAAGWGKKIITGATVLVACIIALLLIISAVRWLTKKFPS